PCIRSGSRAEAPVWVLNGEGIVFIARYKEDQIGSQLYFVKTDGTDMKQLADGYGIVGRYPGYGVVYSWQNGVYLYDPLIGESKSLFESEHKIFWPKFSSNGRRLAYLDENGAIYVAKPDGSGAREVAKFPSLLPDTQRFYWIHSEIDR
ncbi:MAG TPA: hypothetical protein PLZ55_04600, partial [bacterium]|nr:hypothetical protein [bacterium]